MKKYGLETTMYRAIAGQIARLDAFDINRSDDHIDMILDVKCKLASLENMLPSGSGFDAGTLISRGESLPNRLVLCTSYHHMNDGGMYDGWSDHDVIVKPDLQHGIDIRVTGRNRNETKGYIAELFGDVLRSNLRSFHDPDTGESGYVQNGAAPAYR